ncbi:MAG: gamma-glutamyl-gamma-aminobutyrate hydrolase family protein [Anaerolineae bacterium]|nr:gamma-glutamyl-gamma-aminobutyrate hydrolase family protein [Anaerolineae bacterium]
MPEPLIGITTWRATSHLGHGLIASAEAYVEAISHSGGLPVMIPVGLPADQLTNILSSIDGILFTGGGDIDPQRYGLKKNAKVKDIDRDRDRVEIQLVRDAIQQKKPFFGVCRGFQIINVALGGTLYRDIEDDFPETIGHTFYPDWPRDYLAHDVVIDPDSPLAQTLGQTTLEVNSLHHQAADQLATGLEVMAHSRDGLIEAFRLLDHPFGWAVQWHPEQLMAQKSTQILFRKFVLAASG